MTCIMVFGFILKGTIAEDPNLVLIGQGRLIVGSNV